MKRKVIALFIIVICLFTLCACSNMDEDGHDFTVTVSGDVFRLAEINAKSMDSYLFTAGGERYYGFKLGEFLSKVQLRGEDGTLLILGKEGAVELPLSFVPHCYLASTMDGYFNLYNVKNSDLTKGVSGVSEIVFLSKTHSGGILLNDTEVISYRKIFEVLLVKTGTAHSGSEEFIFYQLSHKPYAKNLLNEDYTVSLDSGEHIYISSQHNTTFRWENGRLYIAKGTSPVKYANT